MVIHANGPSFTTRTANGIFTKCVHLHTITTWVFFALKMTNGELSVRQKQGPGNTEPKVKWLCGRVPTKVNTGEKPHLEQKL